VTDAAVTGSHDRVARLWLATLHEIAQRAAHEIKNALNGVAVNLEVVRGRLGRPDATAEGAARFANTAGAEFERVSACTEALLSLSRPPRTPVDVGAELRALRTLLAAGAAGEVPGARAAGASCAGGEEVRLALGAALLAACTDRAAPCAAELRATGTVAVRITCDAPPDDFDPEVADVARGAGIGVTVAPDVITLTFPPLRAGDRSAIGSA
jgi:signal transduction histidine kinase